MKGIEDKNKWKKKVKIYHILRKYLYICGKRGNTSAAIPKDAQSDRILPLVWVVMRTAGMKKKSLLAY